MKILREVAQMMGEYGEQMEGRSDFPNMRNGEFDPAMFEDFDMTQLPKMYRKLSDEVKN